MHFKSVWVSLKSFAWHFNYTRLLALLWFISYAWSGNTGCRNESGSYRLPSLLHASCCQMIQLWLSNLQHVNIGSLFGCFWLLTDVTKSNYVKRWLGFAHFWSDVPVLALFRKQFSQIYDLTCCISLPSLFVCPANLSLEEFVSGRRRFVFKYC
jgi:hypothetical protein